MASPLLILQDIRLTFGGTQLLESAALSVSQGERVCLVGRNGSGKSTLLKIATGVIEQDGGTRFQQPGTTMRSLPQEPDLSGYATTLDYVESGLMPGDDPYRARLLLEELGLTGEENPKHLSGGEARRAALAHVIAPQPDILFLDEPTNHLDLPAIEWLEAELKSMRSALVLISHDRRFLQSLSRTTVWLDRGLCRRLDQGFAAFETWRDTQLEQEETDRHKLDRKIAMEEGWLRTGVSARRKRNQGRLRALGGLREERREARRAATTVTMQATEGVTSGAMVAEMKRVSKHYDGVPIVTDFSTRIIRGDRIGIVGPNGGGKTTLLGLLTGAIAPDAGQARLGVNLQIAMLDQKRHSLDPTWTLAQALTHNSGDTVSVGGQTKHVIGYMKDFLFKPEQARSPVSTLSGGERGRLMLARALAQPSNLLVLDEPTNDLDLETLDLLEELLNDYPGTVLLVSHDRDFLDRVVTSTIAFEGGGQWIEYAGGYSDMIAQRGQGVVAKHTLEGEFSHASTQKPVKAPASTPPLPFKKKMSFKDKHALETLPKQIEALQKETARLQAALAAPNLYMRDPAAFTNLTASLDAAISEQAQAEHQWLELEMMQESLNA